MKLSFLALVLCIGLLIWNAWLQIQLTRLSHTSSSSQNSLKLSSLEIVDEDGNAAIEIQGGKILVSNKQNNELAILDSNSLQLATLKNDKYPNAALRNYMGKGSLSLNSEKEGESLLATPTDIFSSGHWTPGTDVTSVPQWTVDTNMVTKDDLHNDAYVDVNSKSFSTAKSEEGTFLVSCQGVEPYLEGYKVHLQIGNPTMLTVDNAKLTIEWGISEVASAKSDSAKGINDPTAWVSNWKKSLHQTTTTLNESLRPGFWNDVEVIVSPAKADELAHFKVSMQTDSVRLTSPPDQH